MAEVVLVVDQVFDIAERNGIIVWGTASGELVVRPGSVLRFSDDDGVVHDLKALGPELSPLIRRGLCGVVLERSGPAKKLRAGTELILR
jgi:hypothetical protein